MSSPTDPLDDGFTSISWDNKPSQAEHPHSTLHTLTSADPPSVVEAETRPEALKHAQREGEGTVPSWAGRYMTVDVGEPSKEMEGAKEVYISYAVRTRTNIPGFPVQAANQPYIVRHRFTDFVFLQNHLSKLFPAAVVPPMAGKHRMEYIKGDRFGSEFIEHRRVELQQFMSRIARHPILSRSPLVKDFLSSPQWTVEMHKHLNAPLPETPPSLLDNLSDSLVNAFTKVRKPDERFLEMKEGIDKFEEGMLSVERLMGKERGRTEDLAGDYVDLAASYQGLGYLESGITEPLNRFAERMLDFSGLLKDLDNTAIDPFLTRIHGLVSYSQAHKSIIKSRDQKQLDFEELSAYLSAVVGERDRMAALNNGHTSAPVGLTTYLRDQVDKLRGTDDIHTRRERIRKMDGKIKELQEAVTTAHETTTEFNDEIIKEHNIFELSKQQEMKEMMGSYADAQIEFYRKSIEDWDAVVPVLKRIRVDV